ncbi:MAG: putative sugar O-methyltransferase [Alphaproteobacteria bacterium]|nr:putative sugar O-methyltransferase [Alphaproteobacteria bacterium]
MNFVRKKIRKRYYKYLRWRDRGRYFGTNFTHPLIATQLPDIHTSEIDTPLSDDFLGQLCRSYALSANNYKTSGNIWLQLEGKKSGYIAALEEHSFAQLRVIFNRLLKDDLLEGMGHAEALFVDEAKNPYCRNYFQLRTIDALMSLGEALGVYAAPNAIQMSLGGYIEHMNPDTSRLTEKIETALGFSIGMPKFGNPPVIDTNLRLNPDSIRHAYTIHRLKVLGADENTRILEIGGGYGMAALLAHRAGLRNYMILDIPYVASLQGAYLGGSIGEDRVVLAGAASEWMEDSIQIASPDRIDQLPDRFIDFVVNTDSIPEMPHTVAQDYISSILRICQGVFLSINQESKTVHGDLQQGAVRELMAERGYAPSHRFRHWLEQGYVEEVFNIAALQGDAGGRE